MIVIPMAKWDKLAEKALRFGMTLSHSVKVVHVDNGEGVPLETMWHKMVLEPLHDSGSGGPLLIAKYIGFEPAQWWAPAPKLDPVTLLGPQPDTSRTDNL